MGARKIPREQTVEPSLTTDGLMHEGGAIREIDISMIVCKKAPSLFSDRKSIDGDMTDEIKNHRSVRDEHEMPAVVRDMRLDVRGQTRKADMHKVTTSGENAKRFSDRHRLMSPIELKQRPQACSLDPRLWVC